MPDEVHQVGRILAVMDRERGIDPDVARVVTQKPSPNRMECAGPGDRSKGGRLFQGHGGGHNSLDAPGHLGRGSPGEGEEQDTARVRSVNDKVRYPVRQRVGLTGTGAGDHK
jgi:hypothetical protein